MQSTKPVNVPACFALSTFMTLIAGSLFFASVKQNQPNPNFSDTENKAIAIQKEFLKYNAASIPSDEKLIENAKSACEISDDTNPFYFEALDDRSIQWAAANHAATNTFCVGKYDESNNLLYRPAQ
jgi:hypothetical protein